MAGLLPAAPPPGLARLRTSNFQVCSSKAEFDCYYADVRGSFTSITAAPEPSTDGLMLAGARHSFHAAPVRARFGKPRR
jgi:hypothetical protein